MRRTFLCAIAALCLSAHGQANYTVPATTGAGGVYVFGNITGPGQVGNVVSFFQYPAAPANHTVFFSVSGTAPTACTLSLDGSVDGLTWVSMSGPLTCTTAGMYHYGPKPVPYVRVSVSAFTPGDATTKVTVSYARGQ